jgi:hypothetical protein
VLFYEQLFAGLHAMPRVVSASIGWNPPYSIGRELISLPGSDRAPIEVGATGAAPRFFETMGIRLVAGREFEEITDDLQNGVIINGVLADRLWPKQSAVGQRVMFGQQERTVIGVTAELRCRDLLGPPDPCSYQSFPASAGYLRLRVQGDPMAFAPRLRAFIHDLNPLVALAEEKTLAGHVRDLAAAQRMSAIATMTLALVGIVMLAAGCVSLFVSMVRDSVREIAIRMALGATTGRLTRRVLTQGVAVTLTGLTVGSVAARAVAVRIADRLHGVSAWDPFTWVATLAVIALVSLASVHAAAVLATRTDPARLLRAE